MTRSIFQYLLSRLTRPLIEMLCLKVNSHPALAAKERQTHWLPARPQSCLGTGRLSLVLIGLLQACVQPYDPKLTLNEELLVVSGIITDQAQPQSISLSRSRSSPTDGVTSTPLTQARVQVLVNGTALTLPESSTQPGTYELPPNFRGQVGTTYQLQFQTAQGDTYQSSVETMSPVASILQAYDQFNPNGPKASADALPTPVNEVYIDYDDPADSHNFYLWRWRLYEVQAWCATCQQGRYMVTKVGSSFTYGCVTDPSLNTYNLYDYTCLQQCWDIFYSTNIDVFSDVYTNGHPQRGHQVASIPIYQVDPALIAIEQLSLSANAYRYYKLFADQTQNTGTLADSPPAPLRGNVTNLAHPEENVVGYFSAASVAEIDHKIIRINAPVSAGQFRGLFYFENHRLPNVELPRDGSQTYGKDVPSALCIPSHSRTDQVPPGWNP